MLHAYYPPQCWSFICLEPLQVFACCFNCWVHMCKCPSEFGKHYYLVIIHHPRRGLKKETRQSVSSKYRQQPWKRQMEKREIQDICNGGWQAAAWVWDCEAVEKSGQAQSVWKASSVTSSRCECRVYLDSYVQGQVVIGINVRNRMRKS